MKTPDTVLRFYHPMATSESLARGSTLRAHLLGALYIIVRSDNGALSASCTDAQRKPRVLEYFGSIWLADAAYAEPALPLVDFAEEGFWLASTSRVTFAAPLHVAFDNFSEDEHTPWVHNFLGWKEADASAIHFESENFADRTEVYYRGIQRPHALTPALLVRWGDEFHNRWITRFDPIRTVYTLHWATREGTRRPVTTRFAIYFVPETDKSTVLHVLAYAKLEANLSFLKPVVRSFLPLIGNSEVRDDQRFAAKIADTPFEFTGMRLGKYDAPLIHNRRLMKSHYFGSAQAAPASGQ
jgi:hypothetical protein